MLNVGGMITDRGKPKYSEKNVFHCHLIKNSTRWLQETGKVNERIWKKACLQRIDSSWLNWRQYQKPDFLRSWSTRTEFSVRRRRIFPRTV